jgi:hypothetical protein
MISKELIEWFHEEIKKNIADVIEEDCPPTLAVSLHDTDGIVWVEGLLHAACGPAREGPEYLVQYSIQRDSDLPQDCPYSLSITFVDEG